MPKNAENRYNRRLLLQALATAGASAPGAAQTPEMSLAELRETARLHGVRLTEMRLAVLRPVIAQRQAQLRRLREMAIPDSVEPHDRF